MTAPMAPLVNQGLANEFTGNLQSQNPGTSRTFSVLTDLMGT